MQIFFGYCMMLRFNFRVPSRDGKQRTTVYHFCITQRSMPLVDMMMMMMMMMTIFFHPESKRKLDEWTTRDVKKDITIPAEDPLSAPLTDIGKESTLDDYDEVLFNFTSSLPLGCIKSTVKDY